ncbi:hypothetical protein AV530_015307 [Patagioenas fasciata monilis]|uniref:Uncharacterized protein n=1 Tax=Patagioenas fasciata monilis TaxID=372326 RepID=A0A1V4K1P1_PATFA|nr:hypothetical protein AV530_015307 [Patagioenas fasciata monilis]
MAETRGADLEEIIMSVLQVSELHLHHMCRILAVFTSSITSEPGDKTSEPALQSQSQLCICLCCLLDM